MSADVISSEELGRIQDLLADGAEKVVAAAEESTHHYGVFYENPEFWVGLAFVLVVLLLARPVGKLVHAMLTKRINDIAQRINDAQKLKDDAQKLWVEYEKKFLNAKNEAYEILEKSEREIEILKNERIERLEADIKNKENEAANRILAAEQAAVQQIRRMGSELSVKAVKELLKHKLDEKTQNELIDQSIKLLEKF